MKNNIIRKVNIPEGSLMSEQEYKDFLIMSYELLLQTSQYLALDEDVNTLELAHLIPDVPETVLAAYVGINDAVCNKALVTPLFPQHGHNNVFVFDPQVFSGGDDVPSGTADTRIIFKGFEPPNETWENGWTYVMIEDPSRTFQSLWKETGYIDMIPAKFEDFTMLTDSKLSKACIFISDKAFDHPVNKARDYLKYARKKGEKTSAQFQIPESLKGEFDSLVPVVLERGEKLYVATNDFGPCAHGWCNIHPENKQLAIINENSAVPLNLVISKPPVNPKYAKGLIPPKGSADMTTDWFYRGKRIMRKPLLEGLFQG